jgi:hypothetical protein
VTDATAPARPVERAAPLRDRFSTPEWHATWRALGITKFNVDANAIIERGRELLELVARFRATHTVNKYARVLRTTGLGPRGRAYYLATAKGTLTDMASIEWSLNLALDLIESVLVPIPSDPEKLEAELTELAAD